MKLPLSHKEPLEGDVVSFVFNPPEGFTWVPGQYMKYTLPHNNPDDRGTERWFTIAAPSYEGKVRITTRIVQDHPSSFKQALMQLQPGDTIEADAPEGDFVLTDQNAGYVFIAGGIGFTPFHAILAELDHKGEMPKIQVLYGARDASPVFHQELSEFTEKYPQLKVDYVVDPQRVNEDIVRQHVSDLTMPLVYISGPEPMVEAFDTMFKGMGVPETHMHNDYFPGYTW